MPPHLACANDLLTLPMLSLKSNGEYACDATILAPRKRLESAEEQEAENVLSCCDPGGPVAYLAVAINRTQFAADSVPVSSGLSWSSLWSLTTHRHTRAVVEHSTAWLAASTSGASKGSQSRREREEWRNRATCVHADAHDVNRQVEACHLVVLLPEPGTCHGGYIL
jgi:hypothetical protein